MLTKNVSHIHISLLLVFQHTRGERKDKQKEKKLLHLYFRIFESLLTVEGEDALNQIEEYGFKVDEYLITEMYKGVMQSSQDVIKYVQLGKQKI